MIKSIPTAYNGITFRSRLEARWVIFFDYLKIKWIYEHDVFQLSSRKYVPDFWLPELKLWIEIKPIKPTEREQWAMIELVSDALHSGIILFGNVNLDEQLENGSAYHYLCENVGGIEGYQGMQSHYWWCKCPICGKVGIQFEGLADRICRSCLPLDEDWPNYDHPDIVSAYNEAKKYQFVY